MNAQDHNAGNAGDQLKHALLLEVLQRLPRQSLWAYAETHAGAGAYATPVAAELFRAAWGVDAASPMPGAAYAAALCRWWRLRVDIASLGPSHVADAAMTHVLYPGSGVLAALSGRTSGELNLAEADAKAAARLRQALGQLEQPAHARASHGGPQTPVRASIHVGAFEDHLPVLLAPEHLVLLADPFYYDPEASDGAGGRLGRGHLERLIAGLRQRHAVLLTFVSHRPRAMLTVGEAAQLASGTWHALWRDLGALGSSPMRCFVAGGTAHALVVAGWGAGADIVRGLPGAAAWADSWLAQTPVELTVQEERGEGP